MPRAIEPAPPLANDAALPWHAPVDDAVEVIAAARERHGDTFRIEHTDAHGSDRYLFTFSPVGVASFYALREEEASKGVADYLMLRRKLPGEIFDGRRTLPGALFGRDDVARYLANLDLALDRTVEELAELSARGTDEHDVFALTRRLGHRLGLASWAGRGALEPAVFERLSAAFDELDGADAFVRPEAMRAVEASGHAAERAALDDIVAVVGELVPTEDDVLFGRIVDAWSDEPPADRARGVGLDVALVHVASMSNMHAALGWMLVDLLEHPAALDRVRSGDAAYASSCALESTRLAQRSIMARTVMSEVDLDVGDAVYRVPPGWTIATLLPVLNTTAAPGLEQWDPERWQGHRLAPTPGLDDARLVTAFGHGRHTCPAQPFSLTAMARAAHRITAEFDIAPAWDGRPVPRPAQIGGVARASALAPVRCVPRGV
ncbi:cytochrome P450 [Nocardioides sp. R-C-SC26]|uniref:cytochrome P450 n=1 Tax=Nocardioides sp. R-C-SC26 TaxID=2870414 RepID=UPI001E4D1D40|nr:cytochrome P450 [Nocardioides sp. R-C-SC26]